MSESPESAEFLRAEYDKLHAYYLHALAQRQTNMNVYLTLLAAVVAACVALGDGVAAWNGVRATLLGVFVMFGLLYLERCLGSQFTVALCVRSMNRLRAHVGETYGPKEMFRVWPLGVYLSPPVLGFIKYRLGFTNLVIAMNSVAVAACILLLLAGISLGLGIIAAVVASAIAFLLQMLFANRKLDRIEAYLRHDSVQLQEELRMLNEACVADGGATVTDGADRKADD